MSRNESITGTHPVPVQRAVRTGLALLLFTFVAAACAGSPTATLSVPVMPDARDILDGWRVAGVTCNPPEVGMPGPALQWSCRGRFGGLDLAIGMIADRVGLQSIVVGAPAGSDRGTAAEAWAKFLESTNALGSFRDQAVTWLRTTRGTEDWHATGSPGSMVGHLAIAESRSALELYVVPNDAHP
jgi:hypothetical protein